MKKQHITDGRRFVAFEAPPLDPPVQTDQDAPDEELGADAVCPALRDKYDKSAVDTVKGRIRKSISGGSSVTRLFLQQTEEGLGMNLIHAWFGANAQIEAHSHPCYGDCLYYVIAGEIIMGSKRLGPGSVLFVPKDKSYRVVAGPVGLEMLEFRASDMDQDQPMFSSSERSLESLEKIVENNQRHQASWRQPERIGDVAFLQREYDAKQSKLS